jgi:hypothetical protein
MNVLRYLSRFDLLIKPASELSIILVCTPVYTQNPTIKLVFFKKVPLMSS